MATSNIVASPLFYTIPSDLVQSGVEQIIVTPSEILVVLKKGWGKNDEEGFKVLLLSKQTGINFNGLFSIFINY